MRMYVYTIYYLQCAIKMKGRKQKEKKQEKNTMRRCKLRALPPQHFLDPALPFPIPAHPILKFIHPSFQISDPSSQVTARDAPLRSVGANMLPT
jgi:hypothetical protein